MDISRRSFLGSGIKTAFGLYAGILLTGCAQKRSSITPTTDQNYKPQEDPRQNLPWPKDKKPTPEILSCETCATLCYAAKLDANGNQVFENGQPAVLTDEEGNPLIIAIDIPYTTEDGKFSIARKFEMKPVPLKKISNSMVSMTYKDLPKEAYPILFSGLSEKEIEKKLDQLSNNNFVIDDLKKAHQLKELFDKIAQNAQKQIDITAQKQTTQPVQPMTISVPIEKNDLKKLHSLMEVRGRFFNPKITPAPRKPLAQIFRNYFDRARNKPFTPSA